jgi:hypothetical protein
MLAYIAHGKILVMMIMMASKHYYYYLWLVGYNDENNEEERGRGESGVSLTRAFDFSTFQQWCWWG